MTETEGGLIATLRRDFIEKEREPISTPEFNSLLIQLAKDEKSILNLEDDFSLRVLQKVATKRYYHYDRGKQRPTEVIKEFDNLKRERRMIDEAKEKLLKVSQNLLKSVDTDHDLRLVIDRWYRETVDDVEKSMLVLMQDIFEAIKWVAE